jgi:hypothetical protein
MMMNSYQKNVSFSSWNDKKWRLRESNYSSAYTVKYEAKMWQMNQNHDALLLPDLMWWYNAMMMPAIE